MFVRVHVQAAVATIAAASSSMIRTESAMCSAAALAATAARAWSNSPVAMPMEHDALKNW